MQSMVSVCVLVAAIVLGNINGHIISNPSYQDVVPAETVPANNQDTRPSQTTAHTSQKHRDTLGYEEATVDATKAPILTKPRDTSGEVTTAGASSQYVSGREVYPPYDVMDATVKQVPDPASGEVTSNVHAEVPPVAMEPVMEEKTMLNKIIFTSRKPLRQMTQYPTPFPTPLNNPPKHRPWYENFAPYLTKSEGIVPVSKTSTFDPNTDHFGYNNHLTIYPSVAPIVHTTTTTDKPSRRHSEQTTYDNLAAKPINTANTVTVGNEQVRPEHTQNELNDAPYRHDNANTIHNHPVSNNDNVAYEQRQTITEVGIGHGNSMVSSSGNLGLESQTVKAPDVNIPNTDVIPEHAVPASDLPMARQWGRGGGSVLDYVPERTNEQAVHTAGSIGDVSQAQTNNMDVHNHPVPEIVKTHAHDTKPHIPRNGHEIHNRSLIESSTIGEKDHANFAKHTISKDSSHMGNVNEIHNHPVHENSARANAHIDKYTTMDSNYQNSPNDIHNHPVHDGGVETTTEKLLRDNFPNERKINRPSKAYEVHNHPVNEYRDNNFDLHPNDKFHQTPTHEQIGKPREYEHRIDKQNIVQSRSGNDRKINLELGFHNTRATERQLSVFDTPYPSDHTSTVDNAQTVKQGTSLTDVNSGQFSDNVQTEHALPPTGSDAHVPPGHAHVDNHVYMPLHTDQMAYNPAPVNNIANKGHVPIASLENHPSSSPISVVEENHVYAGIADAPVVSSPVNDNTLHSSYDARQGIDNVLSSPPSGLSNQPASNAYKTYANLLLIQLYNIINRRSTGGPNPPNQLIGFSGLIRSLAGIVKQYNNPTTQPSNDINQGGAHAGYDNTLTDHPVDHPKLEATTQPPYNVMQHMVDRAPPGYLANRMHDAPVFAVGTVTPPTTPPPRQKFLHFNQGAWNYTDMGNSTQTATRGGTSAAGSNNSFASLIRGILSSRAGNVAGQMGAMVGAGHQLPSPWPRIRDPSEVVDTLSDIVG